MSETAPDVEPWRRRLREVMTSHSQLVRELLLEGGGIERKAGPPSPLTFMRNHVAKSLPVLYTGAVDHWPALRRWDHSYLRRQAGKLQVHVALTPDGFADAVVTNRKGERVFAKPCETSMAFENFLDAIAQPRVDETGRRRRPVLYVSHQNSSLVAEFEPLWPDVGLELPWATEAFGAAPQAANFWMGEDAAVTTTHADLFDNLYVVIRGEKHFLLFPPQDAHALGYLPFPSATYHRTADGLGIPGIQGLQAVRGVHEVQETRGIQGAQEAKGVEGGRETTGLQGIGGVQEARYGSECAGAVQPDEHAIALRHAKTGQSEGADDSCGLELRMDEPAENVEWCSEDVSSADFGEHTRLTPLKVVVRAGEVLYIPAHWFHHVSQRGDAAGTTIAVNFWYDSGLGPLFAQKEFLEALHTLARDVDV